MGAVPKRSQMTPQIAPELAAEALFTAHQHEQAWLDAFAYSLDRRRAAASLKHVLTVWDLSQSDAARLFGVSRQAISKWLDQGAPPDRAVLIADLSAATDLLTHYLKRDRIPAVVRRPIGALRSVSLMDLLASADTQALLATCREMFSFGQVQDQA